LPAGHKHLASDAVILAGNLLKSDHATRCDASKCDCHDRISRRPTLAPLTFTPPTASSMKRSSITAKRSRKTRSTFDLRQFGIRAAPAGKFPEAIQMLNKALDHRSEMQRSASLFREVLCVQAGLEGRRAIVNKAVKYGQRLDPELREILESTALRSRRIKPPITCLNADTNDSISDFLPIVKRM